MGPYLSTVADTIQTAIAPVFLLAGIGAILNVMVGRLARIVDRARGLEALHPRSTGPEHERHVWELRLIDRRISVINNAIFLCVSSALAVCLVVALMFVSRLMGFHVGAIVAVAFVISMLLLMGGLIFFLIEVHISLDAIHVREELLELDKK
jgi:sterol desaturase/sphingolipid hydroxylase (fatty acid hydroxylase superfamily)